MIMNKDLLLKIHCWAVASQVAHKNATLLCVSRHEQWISDLCAERMVSLEKFESMMLVATALEEPEQLVRYKKARIEFESPERCCMVKSSPPCDKCHIISKEFFASREALEQFGLPLADNLYREHTGNIRQSMKSNETKIA